MFVYENDYIGARCVHWPERQKQARRGIICREAHVKIDSRPSSVTQTMDAGKGY